MRRALKRKSGGAAVPRSPPAVAPVALAAASPAAPAAPARAPAQLQAESDPVERLRAWCRERALYVSPFDEVDERTAAAILDRAPGTLRNLRYGERPIPFKKKRSGVRYSLADLAHFLQE